MNEHQLRRLLHRILLLSVPLPLAILGAGCGGSAVVDEPGSAGSGSLGGSSGAGGGPTAGSGGAGGGAVACKSSTMLYCGGGVAVVPKTCVDPTMAVVGTVLPQPTCTNICNAPSIIGCSVAAVDATSITLQCMMGCTVGRRPAGLSETLPLDGCELGAYFADAARLEAASVDAFRILRDELRAHGAPRKLVRAAGRAARDEIRHARAVGALARRFGARPRPPQVERRALRSIEQVAIENAVEGCVRETYGSLLATRQALLARDPTVRSVMMRIARDETMHASLSWQVARWLETRLARGAKRNVERAKLAAARELLDSVARDHASGFADVGLPTPAEGARLATQMSQALWA